MSAFPLAPPADWFDAAEPDGPEPLTVETDGRVHGHLALWDACHIGFMQGALSECVRPPRSPSDYEAFHLGQIVADGGEKIPVGKVVYGGGHASLAAGLEQARQHYDRTSSVGAFVRARDGRHGIYLTGAARSDLSPEGVRDMRANPPSGDWRRLRGALELVAALAVGVPGYQTPQIALTASADEAQVAAMILPGYTEVEGMDDSTLNVSVSDYRDLRGMPEDRDAGYVLRKRIIQASLAAPLYLDVGLTAAAFTAEQRQRYAKSGIAMSDGSFPIRNCSDWSNARQALGRAAPGKRAEVQAHIAKRGRALGCGDD